MPLPVITEIILPQRYDKVPRGRSLTRSQTRERETTRRGVGRITLDALSQVPNGEREFPLEEKCLSIRDPFGRFYMPEWLKYNSQLFTGHISSYWFARSGYTLVDVTITGKSP